MSGGAGDAAQGVVTLLFFGALSEAVGAEPVRHRFAPGATVATLRRELAGRHPAARAALATCMVAQDRAYVGEDAALRDGAEIAFLPPVSGG